MSTEYFRVMVIDYTLTRQEGFTVTYTIVGSPTFRFKDDADKYAAKFLVGFKDRGTIDIFVERIES